MAKQNTKTLNEPAMGKPSATHSRLTPVGTSFDYRLTLIKQRFDSSLLSALRGWHSNPTSPNLESIASLLINNCKGAISGEIESFLEGKFGEPSKSDDEYITIEVDKLYQFLSDEYDGLLYIISILRDNGNSRNTVVPPVVERLERLLSYAKQHDDETVAAYARLLFPEWSLAPKADTGIELTAGEVSSLPTEAPEKYAGLRGPETPPAFVKRVYGPWLGQGLTRAHIRQLDPTLSKAIDNWLSKPGNEWPADVDLPTKAEQNSREIDALRAGAPDGQIGSILGDFTAREAGRIRVALHRRDQKR